MEQISLSDLTPGKAQSLYEAYLCPALQKVIDNNNLDVNLLTFRAGEGTASNYSSVAFGSSLVCRIRYNDRQNYLGISRRYTRFLPDDAEIKTTKSDPEYVRVAFGAPEEITRYTDSLCRILQEIINAIPKSFDCCSRYEQCSDARKCIQPDKSIALACGYRSILASGRIFYGKNRNID